MFLLIFILKKIVIILKLFSGKAAQIEVKIWTGI